jgi:hypothetical protein
LVGLERYGSPYMDFSQKVSKCVTMVQTILEYSYVVGRGLWNHHICAALKNGPIVSKFIKSNIGDSHWVGIVGLGIFR